MDAILHPDSARGSRRRGNGPVPRAEEDYTYAQGLDSGRQHVRFQFERLDDWKRQEILQKQKRQQEMRDLLEEQIRAKQERDSEHGAQNVERINNRENYEDGPTGVRSSRGRTDYTTTTRGRGCDSGHQNLYHQKNNNQEPDSASMAGSAAQLSSSTDLFQTAQPWGSGPQSGHISLNSDNNEMVEAFSRKFPWKQDAILEKKRQQRELRANLEEQMREKRNARQENPKEGNRQHESAKTPSHKSPQTVHHTEAAYQGRRDRPHLQVSQDDQPDLGCEEVDPSGKMFTWKQEALVAKRREQEKTRRFLEEQMEEKRRAKELAAAKEAEEEAMFQRQAQQKQHIVPDLPPLTTRSESGQMSSRTGRRPAVSEGPKTDDESYKDARNNNTSMNSSGSNFNEELAVLREQVEQQKQLLREQSELMQEMQRQTERSSNRSVLRSSNDTDESKTGDQNKDKNRNAKIKKIGKTGAATIRSQKLAQKSNENVKIATQVAIHETEGRRPARERKDRRKSSLAAPTKWIRECSLRRNSAGKFCIEVEPVLDTFCLIKRIGKSHVPDKRNVLKTGDLVIAIGAFSVRQAQKQLASMDEDSLDALMSTFDVPSYDDVTTMLAKGGSMVNFAVCSADRDSVLRIAEEQHLAAEQQEAEERFESHDAAKLNTFNGLANTEDEFQGYEEDFDEPHEHAQTHTSGRYSHDESSFSGSERFISATAGARMYRDEQEDDDEELRASSTFVSSAEWQTFCL